MEDVRSHKCVVKKIRVAFLLLVIVLVCLNFKWPQRPVNLRETENASDGVKIYKAFVDYSRQQRVYSPRGANEKVGVFVDTADRPVISTTGDSPKEIVASKQLTPKPHSNDNKDNRVVVFSHTPLKSYFDNRNITSRMSTVTTASNSTTIILNRTTSKNMATTSVPSQQPTTTRRTTTPRPVTRTQGSRRLVRDDGVPSWVSQCTDVYMDLGSNVGVQIRKLFEPELYPKSHEKMVRLFNREFGEPALRKRRSSGLCAFGFEPNPKHYYRLKNIENNYARKGWKVHFFPFAVSNKNSTVTFWTESKSPYNDWGATLFKVPGEKQNTPNNVTQIRLADFIKKHLDNKQIKVMKFDVEGAEYEILTDFKFEEMLCQNRIKIIIMEWHQYILKTREWNAFYRTHKDLLDWIQSEKCKVTMFKEIDDESYLHDKAITP